MSAPTTRTVLTFALDGDTFALPVEAVVEIIDPLPVTPVPRAPSRAPGVANIRGIVAPVVDLRERLALAPGEDGPERRMLVLTVPIRGVHTRVVTIADSVEAIIEWSDDAIVDVPEIGTRWPREVIQGLIKRKEDVVALLHADRVFSPEETINLNDSDNAA